LGLKFFWFPKRKISILTPLRPSRRILVWPVLEPIPISRFA